MKPEIYVEFSLVFDNDFDVAEVTRITGITPFECRKRNENRHSPLTNKAIEGFWTVKSSVYMDFDVEKALNDIVAKISPQISNITDICNRYSGEAIFSIVTSFKKVNKPALYFERTFLDVVHTLHATIQIDMYIV